MPRALEDEMRPDGITCGLYNLIQERVTPLPLPSLTCRSLRSICRPWASSEGQSRHEPEVTPSLDSRAPGPTGGRKDKNRDSYHRTNLSP